MEESGAGVADCRCFGELFVRPLRDGVRPLDLAQEAVVSPVDGSVSGSGEAREGAMIQAKGINYPLAELLASDSLARTLDGGVYLTLYLRPRDYHRIHSPLDGTVVSLRHVAGRLFPVKPYMVKGLQGLYVRNERIVMEIQTAVGPMAMVCVAAAGVGNITTSFEIGRGEGANGVRSHRPGRSIAKGDEVARFNLGSTVIMVFPPGQVRLARLTPGQPVRMGQRVATIGSLVHSNGENDLSA